MIEVFYNITFYVMIFIIYTIFILFIYEINYPFTNFLKKYIFSDIPIFQISNDNNFHTIENKKNTVTYRYSFVFIPFGKYKIYILTYREKWEFIKIISLDEVLNKIQKKDYQKLNKNYLVMESIERKLGDIGIKEEIEVLKDNKNKYERRVDKANLKGTIYITLLVGIISIIFTQLDKIFELFCKTNDNIFFIILMIFLLTSFLNFLLMCIFFIKVGNIQNYDYGSYLKKKSVYAYFYVNSHYKKLDSQYSFSYIRNIEDYFIKIIVFLLFIISTYVIIHLLKT